MTNHLIHLVGVHWCRHKPSCLASASLFLLPARSRTSKHVMLGPAVTQSHKPSGANKVHQGSVNFCFKEKPLVLFPYGAFYLGQFWRTWTLL